MIPKLAFQYQTTPEERMRRLWELDGNEEGYQMPQISLCLEFKIMVYTRSCKCIDKTTDMKGVVQR